MCGRSDKLASLDSGRASSTSERAFESGMVSAATMAIMTMVVLAIAAMRWSCHDGHGDVMIREARELPRAVWPSRQARDCREWKDGDSDDDDRNTYDVTASPTLPTVRRARLTI